MDNDDGQVALILSGDSPDQGSYLCVPPHNVSPQNAGSKTLYLVAEFALVQVCFISMN